MNLRNKELLEQRRVEIMVRMTISEMLLNMIWTPIEDLGNIKEFNSIGELIEAIARTINYYNKDRIHSALKMTPTQFRTYFLFKKYARSNEQQALIIPLHKVTS